MLFYFLAKLKLDRSQKMSQNLLKCAHIQNTQFAFLEIFRQRERHYFKKCCTFYKLLSNIAQGCYRTEINAKFKVYKSRTITYVFLFVRNDICRDMNRYTNFSSRMVLNVIANVKEIRYCNILGS